MAHIAKLDSKGIYLGVDEIDDSLLTQDHIIVPAECDLAIGQYQWDYINKTFVPIRNEGQDKILQCDVIGAVALGFVSVHLSGIILPKQTVDWLKFYFNSIDGSAYVQMPMVVEFLRGVK